MPIIEDNDKVCVQYNIPKHIKSLITDDFLREFRNQLFRIHKHYSLNVFAEDGIPMNTSTSGWFAAFGKACLLTNNEQLFNYWRTLSWYDSDIFDYELADLLVERGFILGDISKVIEEQLGITENELRICNDCGGLYSKDMVLKISDTDKDELISVYRCFHCQDIKDTKDNKYNTTDYYRNILEELDKYKETHPLNADGQS